MKKPQYYQGDVGIIPVDEIPATAEPVARENGRYILAHGEITGHAHALHGPRVVMFRDDGIGRTFLKVEGEPAELVHEEHSTIVLRPGLFEIVRQREWTDTDEPIEVAD